MKKKLAIFAAVILITAGTVQAYAATVLDTNIINLISAGFSSIRAYYVNAVNGNSANLEAQYNQKIDKYVDDKATDLTNQIETHKNAEINRAGQELDSYYQSITGETDKLVNDQVQQAKSEITQNVNMSIDDIKKDMVKELENQIKDKFKK